MGEKARGVAIVPVLIGLVVAAVVWVASYRSGGPKMADEGDSPSALASMPIAASRPSGTPETKPAEIAKD
jgi:hypothetical protein